MAIPTVLARAVLDPAARAAGAAVEGEFAPDVVRIRHSVRPDWDGVPSVFVRVVVAAEETRSRGMASLIREVSSGLEEKIAPERYGVRFYSNFRTVGEVAGDPEWM